MSHRDVGEESHAALLAFNDEACSSGQAEVGKLCCRPRNHRVQCLMMMMMMMMIDGDDDDDDDDDVDDDDDDVDDDDVDDDD